MEKKYPDCPECSDKRKDHINYAATLYSPPEIGCTECDCGLTPQDINAFWRENQDIDDPPDNYDPPDREVWEDR